MSKQLSGHRTSTGWTHAKTAAAVTFFELLDRQKAIFKLAGFT